MVQGAMNSFLYPLLLKHDLFGERALACAVLWDLGGNMWICQFALFAVAAYFRPEASDYEMVDDAEKEDYGGEDDEDRGELMGEHRSKASLVGTGPPLKP